MYIQMSAREGQNILVKITEVSSNASNITDSGELGHIVDEGMGKQFAYHWINGIKTLLFPIVVCLKKLILIKAETGPKFRFR